MRRSCFLVTVLAACSGPVEPGDGGDDAPDGGAVVGDGGPDADLDQVDADPGAPDADLGIPLGHDCDVLVDDACAAGLTCRLADAQGRGACRPVGAVPEGDSCIVPDVFDYYTPCADAMVCYGEPNARCMVLCDVDTPSARCTTGETCVMIIADSSIGLCN